MKTPLTFYIYRTLSAWLPFLALCFSFALPANAISDREDEADILKHMITQESSPARKIPALGRLAKLYDLQPEQQYYLKQQYELAVQIDSIPAAYEALANLETYYFNIPPYNKDSLLYWGGLVDSIARSRNEYPNALFIVKAHACSDLMWREDYEMAMNAALDMYRLACEQKQTYGLIRSSESLGYIYRNIGRDSEAVQAYQEGIEILDTLSEDSNPIYRLSNSDRTLTQMRMLSLQLESCCRTDQPEKAEAIAKNYKKVIKIQERLNEQEGDTYAVKREYWLYYSLCTNFYIRSNQFEKAKAALKQAALYEGNVFAENDHVIMLNLFTKALYHQKTGNLYTALDYIDQALERSYTLHELQLKAEIMKNLGKPTEVLTLYDEIYSKEQKKNDNTFLRQLNQFQTLHELNEEEAQSHELFINNQRMKDKQFQLFLSLSIVVILLFMLYILFRFTKRTNKLKDELEKEKNTLLQSESELIVAKRRAEDANHMKSAFIANMSHEIRTPLNAIVGFSGLLIEELAEAEEREEFVKIIRNNTTLLLSLINDVLDLSRMEAGDMKFKLQAYSLKECCQKSLDSIRQRVAPEVRLTFTPAPEPIVLHTDTLRLQQVLLNLLGNAVKFTTKGEINLSYELIDNGKNVRIAITDTGYGIPLEKQAAIFKRFEKLDDYQPGAGLGLSICRLIVKSLGGTISIDPLYTTGARFVVTHPCKSADASDNPSKGETSNVP